MLQTAMNPVVALELLATGAWTGAGVLGPEAFDAAPFLALLEDYGEPVPIEDRPAVVGPSAGLVGAGAVDVGGAVAGLDDRRACRSGRSEREGEQLLLLHGGGARGWWSVLVRPFQRISIGAPPGCLVTRMPIVWPRIVADSLLL